MERKDRSLLFQPRTEGLEGLNGETSNIVVAGISPTRARPPHAQKPGGGTGGSRFGWDVAVPPGGRALFSNASGTSRRSQGPPPQATPRRRGHGALTPPRPCERRGRLELAQGCACGAGADTAPAGRSMGLEPGRGGAQGGCGPGWGSGGAAEDRRGAEHGDGRGLTAHTTCWTQAHAGLSSAAGAGSSYRGWGRGASAVGIKSLSVCRDQAFRIGMSFTTGRRKRGPTSPSSCVPDTSGEGGVG